MDASKDDWTLTSLLVEVIGGAGSFLVSVEQDELTGFTF